MSSIEITLAAATATLLCLLAIVVVMWRRRDRQARTLEATLTKTTERFAGVTDLDDEKTRLRKQIETEERAIAELKTEYKSKHADAETGHSTRLMEQAAEYQMLRDSYREKKAIYDRLLQEVAIFDEKLSFAEMGLYEPDFDFTDSEDYKSATMRVPDDQKRMVSDKTAVVCTTKWAVDGSAAKGQTMTNRNIRLTLRAFNNECDAAIANARWNNVNAMEKRIVNARSQIDKMNASNSTYIAPGYLQLKLKELYLAHEHREKIKAEREERAEMARLAREEQKLIRDIERAEEEEAHYQQMLAKARAEANRIVGPQLAAFADQIETLEQDLADAQARLLRAQAMAEKTRSGYVYIISNVGSFGEDVVKIGLTRRLDPADRVRELGDASVPFIFDTHAIIYSDDAPGLERALHAAFEPARVNTQNYRKEFFRANLDDVESAVKRLAPDAAFFKDIEAQDYRETLAKRNALLTMDLASTPVFPVSV